jgi:hypothetical protein
MKEVLALMYTDIIEFHRKAIRFFSGKGTGGLIPRLRVLLIVHSFSLAKSLPFALERLQH